LIAWQEQGQMRIEGQDGAKQTLGSENILLLYGERKATRKQTRRVNLALSRFVDAYIG
jgi:hypothetical protein